MTGGRGLPVKRLVVWYYTSLAIFVALSGSPDDLLKIGCRYFAGSGSGLGDRLRRYAMTSARSFGSAIPANVIFVPGE